MFDSIDFFCYYSLIERRLNSGNAKNYKGSSL